MDDYWRYGVKEYRSRLQRYSNLSQSKRHANTT